MSTVELHAPDQTCVAQICSTHMFLASNAHQELASRTSVVTKSGMPAAIDLLGQQYGRLSVVGFAGRLLVAGRMRRCWHVVCDCGVEFVIDSDALRDGRTNSCGCLRTEMIVARSTKHGCKTRSATADEYTIWVGMKKRCHNPNDANYRYYGAKGVLVCEAWRNSFEAFFASVGPRPSKGHSIDRIDPFGNYEPGNVRWATRIEQANNTRKKQIDREWVEKKIKEAP